MSSAIERLCSYLAAHPDQGEAYSKLNEETLAKVAKAFLITAEIAERVRPWRQLASWRRAAGRPSSPKGPAAYTDDMIKRVQAQVCADAFFDLELEQQHVLHTVNLMLHHESKLNFYDRSQQKLAKSDVPTVAPMGRQVVRNMTHLGSTWASQGASASSAMSSKQCERNWNAVAAKRLAKWHLTD